MSLLLGIDLGDRRIGVAAGDAASGTVAPLLTLRRSTPERDAAAIRRLCQERGVDAVVVGLPMHLDGSEGEQAERTRAWVEAIQSRVGVPVRFRDERRTSLAARARIGRQPRGRSGGPPSASAMRAWRARIDREAAAAIVQAELDALAGDPEPSA